MNEKFPECRFQKKRQPSTQRAGFNLSRSAGKMLGVGIYIKCREEEIMDSVDHELIETKFQESGLVLPLLRGIETFKLVIRYKTAIGADCRDTEGGFPKYQSHVVAGNVSSATRPIIYWEARMLVYPFGSGISGGRTNKKVLAEIMYSSKTGVDEFKTALAMIPGYECGHLSVWFVASDGAPRVFDDQTAPTAIMRGRFVFLMVDHASYSSINAMSVFPQFGNFNDLCPNWSSLTPVDIFDKVTETSSPAFEAAVKDVLMMEQSKHEWATAVDAGYRYLACIQPIFRPPLANQDYPEILRRSITDPVLMVAAAYVGAAANLEFELWSDAQKIYPCNVMGHGPLDYLFSAPGRADGPALGKRVREDVALPTVVATEGAAALTEAEKGDEGVADDAQTIAEEKTRKTVAGSLPQVFSQAHDSMLDGAGKLKRTADPSKPAERVATKRFTVVSTGQSYYFFLLLWPDATRKPTVHFLAKYPLRYLPQLIPLTTRDSGAFPTKDGSVEPVVMEEYALVVAAVVTCLKGDFTL